MKALIFAKRVTKEIVRDPLSLFFGIAFPLILLLLLFAINANIPVDLFNMSNLAPGIIVFSLSFMALFTAQVLSKDRATLLLARLYTTSMTAKDFIAGYYMPLVVMGLIQAIITLGVSLLLGLQFSWHFVVFVICLIPITCIYVGIGLICGSLLSEKAAAALCGAVLTNLAGWLSGVWFDLNLVGGLFKDIAYLLPFVHAVELCKAVLAGPYELAFPHVWWVLGYAIVISIIAMFVFKKAKDRI